MKSSPALARTAAPSSSRRPRSLVASSTLLIVTVLTAAASLACVPKSASIVDARSVRNQEVLGHYRADDFVFHGRSLAVALRDGQLAPADDWALINTTNPDSRRELEAKRGDRWTREFNLDVRGSGLEDTRIRLPRYDLLFRHRTTGASLSVRTHPMSTWARAVSLRALADDRIDADSAEMAYAIAQGSSASVSVDVTERVAILRGGAAVSVDRDAAYAFEYHIHDTSRFELELPESPFRVRTVFIRPTWNWSLANRGWPVIVEITLSARDVDFDSVSAALDDLVGRIRLAPEGLEDEVSSRDKEAIRQCFVHERLDPHYVGILRNSRRFPIAYVVDDHDEVRLPEEAPLRRCIGTVLRRQRMATASRFLGLQFAGRTEPAGFTPYSSEVWSHLDLPVAHAIRARAPDGSGATPAEPDTSP